MQIAKLRKTELKNLFLFIGCSFIGYILAQLDIFFSFSTSQEYKYLINFILSIGLYASVSDINIESLRDDKKVVVKAVTIGVLLKVAIIFLITHFIFSVPSIEALILAIIVAQIDPLSVSAILDRENNSLSKRADTIIRAWSSFDDPITAILAIFIAATYLDHSGGYSSNIITILALLLTCCIIGILYYKKKFSSRAQLTLFAVFLILATVYQQFFVIALSALFIRTEIIRNIIKKIVPFLYNFSIILMGMKLVEGINISYAMVLAGAAICSQIIVGYMMTSTLPVTDRWFISFSQQNGLTAIVLSLLLLKFDPQLTSIVAPAILIINIMHMIFNTIINNGIRMEKLFLQGRRKRKIIPK